MTEEWVPPDASSGTEKQTDSRVTDWGATTPYQEAKKQIPSEGHETGKRTCTRRDRHQPKPLTAEREIARLRRREKKIAFNRIRAELKAKKEPEKAPTIKVHILSQPQEKPEEEPPPTQATQTERPPLAASGAQAQEAPAVEPPSAHAT
jgi:hypothetical protein